jgi:hypothetical protein
MPSPGPLPPRHAQLSRSSHLWKLPASHGSREPSADFPAPAPKTRNSAKSRSLAFLARLALLLAAASPIRRQAQPPPYQERQPRCPGPITFLAFWAVLLAPRPVRRQPTVARSFPATLQRRPSTGANCAKAAHPLLPLAACSLCSLCSLPCRRKAANAPMPRCLAALAALAAFQSTPRRVRQACGGRRIMASWLAGPATPRAPGRAPRSPLRQPVAAPRPRLRLPRGGR